MSTQEEPTGNNLNSSTYQGVSQLLNSIARDLDHMLFELGQSPPPSPVNSHIADDFTSGSHYRRAAFQQSNQNSSRNSSGDALLEQFVQSLIDSLTLPRTPDGRSSVLSSASFCPLELNGGGQTADNSSQVIDNSEGVVNIVQDDVDQACDISILERIIRTHPVWFLPTITRPGAIHLLQGKEIGNFIVRKSSKQSTMAISVRLPDDKGPYIEHYLIEASGREYHLEGSDNRFEAIPTLVAHYCQCCDELPVQLTLPHTIALASNRQELSSLAMLGQDFWATAMAKALTITEHTLGQSDHFGSSLSPIETSSPILSTFKQKPLPVQTAMNLSSSSIVPMDSNRIYESSSSTAATSNSSKNSTLEMKTSNLSPPPPPPRWCKPHTSFNATNFTVTTTVTFNVNQCLTTSSNKICDTKSDTSNSQNSEPLKRPQTLSDNRNSKLDKLKKTSTHYTQSNIIESPPDYYRSSLADKISDYEDIWASPSKPDTPHIESKYEFVTFKMNNESLSPKKMEHKIYDSTIKLNQTDLEKVRAKEAETLVTESDDRNEKKNGSTYSINSQSSLSGAGNHKLGLIAAANVLMQDSKREFSPFYTEPVDAVKKGVNLAKVKHRNKVPHRLLNHRHSDPNIQWPFPKSTGVLETIFAAEDGQTLSSSLDNLNHKNLFALENKEGFINAGFHSQSSQLHHLPKHEKMAAMQEIPKNMFPIDRVGSLPMQPTLPFMLPKLVSNKSYNDASWPVDSSWEWLGNDDDSLLGDSDLDDDATVESLIRKDAKFPLGDLRRETSMDSTSIRHSDRITVEDLIQQKSPDLHVPEIQPLTKSNLLRVSEYDNLDDKVSKEKDNFAFDQSETASSMTEFSEPWDSSRWDQLLQFVNEVDVIHEEQEKEKSKYVASKSESREVKKNLNEIRLLHLDDTESKFNLSSNVSLTVDDGTSLSSLPVVAIDRNRTQEKSKMTISSTNVFLLRGRNRNLGYIIKEYVIRLSQDKSTTFGNTIDHFIRCTLEGHETNPHVVMRNVRQFMSGIKNYLVKSGEGQFETVVQSERSKLKANEFLNLDAILESVLNKIVVRPLKKHIYQLFVNDYTRNGALKLLSDNIKYARMKTPEEFGIKRGFNLPKGLVMDSVHHYLRRLQQVYSPIKKLENLLAATASIFKTMHSEQGKGISVGTDDFLPLLMYVLVHCGMIAAEIEADYMWGLLHPSLLTGEGGYYLTTLSSAVHVLKNFKRCHEDKSTIIPNAFETKENVPKLSDMQGFMKILIPDELNGSIISKTFPIRPKMNTKEVGKMIAHKFNITNPQDYGLVKLVNGEETLLMEYECPHSIKAELQTSGMDCAFAYKRVDAKIAWPLSNKS